MDYLIIDADGHVVEDGYGSKFEMYLEGKAAQRVKLVPLEAQHLGIIIDGEQFPRNRGGAKHPRTVHGVDIVHIQRERAGNWDPHARIKYLDADGIGISVLFSSCMPLQSYAYGAYPQDTDPQLAAAISRAYNNWIADFCKAYPTRYKASASVPLADIELALSEGERAVNQLGCVAITMLPYVNGKTLDHHYYHPLYALVQSWGGAIGVHSMGAVEGSIGVGRYGDLFFNHIFHHPFEQMLAMASVVAGGVLDQFPRLRFAFLEGDSGWLPWWVDRLDDHYEKLASLVPAKAEPSEYIKGSQCYVGSEVDETTFLQTAEAVGEDHVVFASDYCHWDSKMPGAVAAILDRPTLPDRLKRKILSENPARLYRLAN